MKYFFIAEDALDADEATPPDITPTEKTLYGPFDTEEEARRVRFRLWDDTVHDWFHEPFEANVGGAPDHVE
jgi:hypothetical protein